MSRTTIALIALGSRGDVQPIVALGAGLRAAGHSVRVATHESLRPFVERNGFEFRCIRPDLGGMLQEQRVRESMERGDIDMIVTFARIMRERRPQLDAMAFDILDACRGADAIVYPKVYGACGYYIAKGLGIPGVAFALQPADPTGDFATLALPHGTNLGRWANSRSHAFAINALGWQPYRSSAQAMVRANFPTLRVGWRGPFGEMHHARTPTLYAFSECVVPRPSDWDDCLRITGYWWLDDEAWAAPADLLHFLESGLPPVYIGFGSMPSGSARFTEVVLGGLRASGQRAIFSGPWDGLAAHPGGDSVFRVTDVPHGWLFPRMAAVVHHSGAGTTAAALRAGVPSVNVPFFIDQPFWGQRVRALGVGPDPIPMQTLTADRLSAAIRRAATDAAMRDRAETLGRRLRAEVGVAKAVQSIEAALLHQHEHHA